MEFIIKTSKSGIFFRNIIAKYEDFATIIIVVERDVRSLGFTLFFNKKAIDLAKQAYIQLNNNLNEAITHPAILVCDLKNPFVSVNHARKFIEAIEPIIINELFPEEDVSQKEEGMRYEPFTPFSKIDISTWENILINTCKG